MKKRYYIAYGSNLNIRQMRMRCPSARIIGTSEIPDYELFFKGSKTGSYLTIEPKEGSRVPVAAWEVSAEDELALDRYEGFPNFSTKKRCCFRSKESEAVKSGCGISSCTSCTRTDRLDFQADFILPPVWKVIRVSDLTADIWLKR